MIVVGGVLRPSGQGVGCMSGHECVDSMPFIWWARDRLEKFARSCNEKGIWGNEEAVMQLLGELDLDEKPSNFTRRMARWRSEQLLIPLATLEDMLTGSGTLLADIYPVAADEIEEWEAPPPRVCAGCGTSIEHRTKRAFYCKPTCGRRARRHGHVSEPTPCAYCGKEISLDRSSLAQFCNDLCRVRARQERLRRDKPRATACMWCDKPLDMALHANTRYCSPEHLKAATAARRKVRREDVDQARGFLLGRSRQEETG